MSAELLAQIEDLKRLASQNHQRGERYRELLRKLVVDIEAMACTQPDEYLVEQGVTDEWFGPFETNASDSEGCGSVIEWPCVRILANEALALLDAAERHPHPINPCRHGTIGACEHCNVALRPHERQDDLDFFRANGFTWEYPGFLDAPLPGHHFTVGLDEPGVFIVQVMTDDGCNTDYNTDCSTREQVLAMLDQLRKELA